MISCGLDASIADKFDTRASRVRSRSRTCPSLDLRNKLLVASTRRVAPKNWISPRKSGMRLNKLESWILLDMARLSSSTASKSETATAKSDQPAKALPHYRVACVARAISWTTQRRLNQGLFISEANALHSCGVLRSVTSRSKSTKLTTRPVKFRANALSSLASPNHTHTA